MEHILKLEQVKKYYGGAAGNITKAVETKENLLRSWVQADQAKQRF